MSDLVTLGRLKAHLNINLADTSNDVELQVWLDAVAAHVANAYGPLPSAYTGAVPDDLKAAVLEDIRGLYQPSQLGPPASMTAFGMDAGEPAQSFRPVSQWPRVDAWISSRLGSSIG